MARPTRRDAGARRVAGSLGRTEGEALTVVFDGRPFELEEREGVEVVFASRVGRDAADDDIVALVRASDSPAELAVITSDDNLARRVRALGAEVVGAGVFRRRLDGL